MGLGGVVHVVCVVHPAGSCGLHSQSNGGEGNGEVGESRRESSAAVSYGEGDKFYPTPMSLEGRDDRGVFLGLGIRFSLAA